MIDQRQLAEYIRRQKEIERLRNKQQKEETGQFRDFHATELYCPKCRCAMPVREKMILILPDGDLYEYYCTECGTSVGEKKVTGKENIQIIV